MSGLARSVVAGRARRGSANNVHPGKEDADAVKVNASVLIVRQGPRISMSTVSRFCKTYTWIPSSVLQNSHPTTIAGKTSEHYRRNRALSYVLFCRGPVQLAHLVSSPPPARRLYHPTQRTNQHEKHHRGILFSLVYKSETVPGFGRLGPPGNAQLS